MSITNPLTSSGSLALAAVAGMMMLAGGSDAQNTTCTPFTASDSLCGFLAPAPTVFYPEQALKLQQDYASKLALICSDIREPAVAAVFPFVFCLGILFTKTEQPTFLLFFSFLPPLLSSPVPFGSVLLGLGFPDRSTHTHDFIFSLSHSLSRSLFCTSTSTSMEKKIRRWKKRSKVKA